MSRDPRAGSSALSVDVFLSREELRVSMIEDLRLGLTAQPKWVSPVWFYDERGSSLFDAITRLPEYYLTRAERRLLEANGPEIAGLAGSDTFVELGAGTCDKSRVLLDAMDGAGTLSRYVPLDVSEATLREAARCLSGEYPRISIHAVVGDFLHHVDQVPSEGKRMIAFLGSTLGNLDPDQRRKFFFDLDCVMTHGDSLLVGTDLVKDPRVLVAAYDDGAGVTAEFNRNMLSVLNADLGATFDPSAFEHVAVWDEKNSWIEMRLRSKVDQVVRVKELGLEIGFVRGEEMRTEISTKFTRSGVEAELYESGFVVRAMWEDPEGFLLTLAVPYC
jgi:L-histidine Nalpha-methyltransferase